MKVLNITIPIIWIKAKLYLIGSNRISCELKRDQLMLRVGGGYEKFEEYIPKNHRYFQRMLVIHMIKSGESLEWVIDALINGRKIKNLNQEIQQEAMYLNKFRAGSLSPSGSRKDFTPTRDKSRGALRRTTPRKSPKSMNRTANTTTLSEQIAAQLGKKSASPKASQNADLV